MRQIFAALFLLFCLFVSVSSVAIAPVDGLPAKALKVAKEDEEPEPEPDPEPPGSIGETDSIIENMLGLLDKITIQIENLHVNIDLQPNIEIQLNFGDLFAPFFNFLGQLFGVHDSPSGPSNAEVLARIEQGFRLLDARLTAFESRLERLFVELRLVIQLAMYHPIRTEIHLLLSELHATLKKPTSDARKRFITKCTLNDPLDNLFRLYRLVDEKVTANMLPSITEAAEYHRSTFLKFGRMFLSDGSLAGLLTSACDAFSKTKPPRRQRAVSLLRSTGGSLREHLVNTYTLENRRLINNAIEELKNQVSSNAGSGSNAVIASRAHAFFRNKYPYTRRNWGVVVFNKRQINSRHPLWLVPSHVGQGYNVHVINDVAGRMAVLHIEGENQRDFNWESRVTNSIQHVQVANDPESPAEVQQIVIEKLGDAPRGFMVLVRNDLEVRTDSLSDVVHDRPVCARDRKGNGRDDCITWTIVLGKN